MAIMAKRISYTKSQRAKAYPALDNLPERVIVKTLFWNDPTGRHPGPVRQW